MQLRARTTRQYDDQGRVFSSEVWDVDPTLGGTPTAGLVTGYWYDQRGNLIKTSAPGGLVTKTVFDGANRPITVYETDGGDTRTGSANGLDGTWAQAGDVIGDDVLTETEIQYDKDGNAVLVTMRDRFHSDADSLTGPLGDQGTNPEARVTFVAHYYDAADRLIADANVGTNYDRTSGSFTLYDGLTTTIPDRSDTALVTTYGYDAAGRLEDVTDPRGITTRTLYDALGRATETIQAYDSNSPSPFSPNNVITDYAYDGDNHETSVTDAAGNATTYAYGVSTTTGSNINSKDILASTTYPAVGAGVNTTETYKVDAQGERVSFTDRNGTTHAYTYDVLGRLILDDVTGALGAGVDGTVTKLGYSFDSAGRPFQFTSYYKGTVLNQVERTYNGLGQLTTEYQEHSGAVNTATSPSVQYTYSEMQDDFGAPGNHSRLTRIIYPNGRTVRYYYGQDDLNYRVSRLTASYDADAAGDYGTELEQYAYLGLSTIVQRQRPQDDTELTYVHDSADTLAGNDGGDQYTGPDRFGRIADQWWATYNPGTGAVIGTVDRFQYGYDRDGNVLYKDNLLSSVNSELYHANGSTAGYDSLNRLTDFAQGVLSDTNGDGVPDTVATASHAQSWSLDVLGNWDSNTVDGSTNTSTFNSQNQISTVDSASYAYDSNGNLTNNAHNTLTYDAWNRLVSWGKLFTAKSEFIRRAIWRELLICRGVARMRTMSLEGWNHQRAGSDR